MKDSRIATNRIPYFCYGALYFAAIAFTLGNFARYESPLYGYTWLPRFGAVFHEKKSETFKQTEHMITSLYGYDGQFYAHLAIDPLLLDSATLRAMDNPSFRARRIFFSATAFVAGGGDPQRVVQVYSIQNLVFWLIIAILLLYWLPPKDWENTLRYLCLLFTSGLVASLSHSLLDGPAMALVLLGVLLAERRRNTASAIALGCAGLGKETSIFTAVAIELPDRKSLRSLGIWLIRMSIVAAPLFLWFLYLRLRIGSSAGVGGSGAFDWPLFGWAKALGALLDKLSVEGWLPFNYITALFLTAIPIQVVCILAKPRLDQPWWRVGAVFAVLTVVLGYAVWEGVTVAAARVVLPLTFAFNILHPRGVRWLPLLLAGNAISFAGFTELIATKPPRVETSMSADFQSRLPFDRFPYPNLAFTDGWYPEEKDKSNTWRWTAGEGTLTFENATGRLATATLEFSLHTRAPRSVTIDSNGEAVATYDCPQDSRQEIKAMVPLAPGHNTIRFFSPEPAINVPLDTRDLSFAIENPHFHVD